MLLNVLQCTGQAPATKNCLIPNVNSTKVEHLLQTVTWHHSPPQRPSKGISLLVYPVTPANNQVTAEGGSCPGPEQSPKVLMSAPCPP